MEFSISLLKGEGRGLGNVMVARDDINMLGGMDCVTASYAGVAGFNPSEKKQNFVSFSFYHNPPITIYYLICISVIDSLSAR